MRKIGTYYNSSDSLFVLSSGANNYPAFGSLISTRSWSDPARDYRYGFNGKEKDFETSNDNYDFGARIYDGRLGRWLSLDPLMKKYPNLSPYNFVSNNPVIFLDADGRDLVLFGTQDAINRTIAILNSGLGSQLVTYEYDAINQGYQVRLKNLSEEEIDKLSEEQKKNYYAVKDVIGEAENPNDEKNSTTYEYVNDNLGLFFIGDYKTGNIDLQQIESLGNGENQFGIVSSFTALMHELIEQKERQVINGNLNYRRDHTKGQELEEELTGYLPEDARGNLWRDPESKLNGVLTLKYVKTTTTYDKDKKETITITETVEFNVTIKYGKVSSVALKSALSTKETTPDPDE